jgi:hypothetical protein
MLSEKQKEYLADFERLQKDETFIAEWAKKWGRTHEMIGWPADPEFKAAYFAIKGKYDQVSKVTP